MRISLCVITLNEESNLARCLQSTTGLVDEILVLDSGSADKTPEIAKRFGARFEIQPWLGYVGQKNKALSLASHPWILSLDADEELSPELRQEINRIKTGPEPSCAAFSMPRCVLYEGRWIRHGDWYPDRLARLFRKENAHFTGGKVHERLEIAGSITSLQGEIYHHSFKNAQDHWERCVKYAQLWAESAHERGKRGGVAAGMAHGIFRFARAFLFKRGFMDGRLGVRIALFSAREVFLKYKILGQLRKKGG